MPDSSDPRWIRLHDCDVDLRRQVVVRSVGTVRLSEREAQVVHLLLEAEGGVVTRQDLESQVWGLHPGVVSEAVPVAMRRLRKKIELDPRNPVNVITVRGTGWALRVPRRTVAVEAGRLPGTFDQYFGRDALVQTVLSQLERGGELLTLWGTAGVGKTRLCLEVMRRWRGAGGEVAFCELTPCATQDQVVAAVADALEVRSSDHLERQVGYALAARPEQVLVLDNAEHVLDAVSSLLVAWRAAAPEARMLVTSREPLAVSGERVCPVPPLDRAAAVALLRERAERRAAGCLRSARPEDLEALVDCLDRLPLALELAAARLGVLDPKSLIARLGDSLAVLASKDRDRPERQRTMRSAVAWSWTMLSPRQRACLVHLCAFASAASLQDLDAVLPAEAIQNDRMIQDLVDRSLVRVSADAPERTFSAFEAVRSFVSDEAPELVQRARHRHRSWASSIAARCARGLALSDERDNLTVLQRYESELHRALDGPDDSPSSMVLPLALSLVARHRGPQTERLILLQAAWRHRVPDDDLEPFLIRELAQATWQAGRGDEARALLGPHLDGSGAWWARHRALLAEIELRAGRAHAARATLEPVLAAEGALPESVALVARVVWLRVLANEGQRPKAIESLYGIISAFEALHEHHSQLWATAVLGVMLQFDNQFSRAIPVFRWLSARYHQSGDTMGEGHALSQLAHSLATESQLEEAEQTFAQAIEVLNRAGAAHHLGAAWLQMGWWALLAGRYDEALVRLAKAEHYVELSSSTPRYGHVTADQALALWAQGHLDEAQQRMARALGVLPAGSSSTATYRAAAAVMAAEAGSPEAARGLAESADSAGASAQELAIVDAWVRPRSDGASMADLAQQAQAAAGTSPAGLLGRLAALAWGRVGGPTPPGPIRSV